MFGVEEKLQKGNQCGGICDDERAEVEEGDELEPNRWFWSNSSQLVYREQNECSEWQGRTAELSQGGRTLEMVELVDIGRSWVQVTRERRATEQIVQEGSRKEGRRKGARVRVRVRVRLRRRRRRRRRGLAQGVLVLVLSLARREASEQGQGKGKEREKCSGGVGTEDEVGGEREVRAVGRPGSKPRLPTGRDRLLPDRSNRNLISASGQASTQKKIDFASLPEDRERITGASGSLRICRAEGLDQVLTLYK